MANTNKKPKQPKSPLIGNQAKPTILDNTTKLDIDTKGTLADNIIYAGLNGRLDTADLENFTNISNSRDQVYQLIDTMSQDSAVAAIIRTYTEDVCETADNGHIMWCESSDPKISKFVNYLLNVINVDKNIFGWTYCLLKYGDVYLRLYRESDYKDCLFRQDKVNTAFSARNVLNEDLREQVNLNIHAVNDPYSYYVEMVSDPSTMFELDKYGKVYGYVEVPNMKSGLNTFSSLMTGAEGNTNVYNFRLKSSDVNIYQADDFVHACLEDNFTRFPETVDLFLSTDDFTNNSNSQSYSVKRGKSLLYDSYKVWREKALLENAAMLNRITRSSIFRKVQVEVGDMPKEKVKQILRYTKEMMEQKTAINTNGSMAEYSNPGPMENFIYFATHNGQGGVSVESIGGDVDVKNLADLDWWNNKFYSSYGIPKQYFGWCFSKDTEILLLNGEKLTIEELYNNKDKYIGKGIMACNSDGSLCPTKIANVMQTSTNADLIRVHLDNGKYVDVTPDHRMMLRDGTFKRADELKENDSLMPYYDKIKDGRRLVLDNKLGKFVYQYHAVAEAAGIPVEAGYNIHHKNRIKIDDDFDNLVKLSTEEHCKEHNLDLAAEHKKANEKRKKAGLSVNANVGGHYITNGEYYTTLKQGEELPDGFWFEGPKKSAETKAKISAAHLGKAKNYDNTSHLNTPEIQAKSLAARQATYDLQTGRKEFLVRCPKCNKISKVKITPEEYTKYLNSDKFYYCSADCRAEFDYNGKLETSLALYNEVGQDINKYEEARRNLGPAGSKYFTAKSLETKLDALVDYVPEVNHKVTKIEYLSSGNTVYDITVDADCHTFALPCGIFVHNCDDSTGFNGGTSLTILSSVYAKGVKRVQNAMIQAITDLINLILVNKGCTSYLNNFVLKMKAPLTQEEIDYRADLTNRASAISNLQSIFTDIEDKSRRLKILKELLLSLNYGDGIINEINEEIKEAEETKIKEAEEAEKAAQEEAEKEALALEDTGGDDLDLAPMPDENLPQESFKRSAGTQSLTEDSDFLVEDDNDLPTPEEADKNRDFSENE